MANGTPASKPKPRKSSAAAAKAAAAEAANGEQTFDWRGVQFTRPAKIPATIAFDLADLEGSEDFGAVVRVLNSLIGKEQVSKFRDQLATDGDDLEDLGGVLSDFLTLAFEDAGVTPGESPASDGS